MPEPTPRRTKPAYEVAHGALDYAELRRLGLDPSSVLDFSSNVNPYGPSPRVFEALAKAAVDRYPDRDCLALREAISRRLGVETSQVLVGNGTSELLWLTAFAWLAAGDAALVVDATYGEYARASRLMGGSVTIVPEAPELTCPVSAAEVARALAERPPVLCFVCNPNNPTGRLWPAGDILAWADGFSQTLFVVDEAYLDFVPGAESLATVARSNVLVLGSLTKAQALAGLRVGYAVGPASVIETLRAVRPPWSVSGPAQAAAIAALEDEEHLTGTLKLLRLARDELLGGLRSQGLVPCASETHFFLLPVADGPQLRDQLLTSAVQVRDCLSFGSRQHIRIGTRLPEDNQRLLSALRNIGP